MINGLPLFTISFVCSKTNTTALFNDFAQCVVKQNGTRHQEQDRDTVTIFFFFVSWCSFYRQDPF